MGSLTIVIPTYNRKAKLRRALEGYAGQSKPKWIRELIVVDDGSTDDTGTMIMEFQARAPFAVRYFRQEHRGPAAARNTGMKNAAAGIILFSDSDIEPSPTLVEQHLNWHAENPAHNVAVLGYVTWAPEVNPTPFMRWYGEEGPLFAYGKFQQQREIDFRWLYTCNLSLKTIFLREVGGFDEDFKGAGWEDVELGYRSGKRGLRLLYNNKAVGFHHQFFSFADACRKAASNAAALKLFLEKDAGREFGEMQRRRKSRIRYRISSTIATGIGSAFSKRPTLLDSRFALPSIVYQCAYWYCTNIRES